MEDSPPAYQEKDAAGLPPPDTVTVDFQPPPDPAYPSQPPSYTPGWENVPKCPIGPRIQGYATLRNESEPEPEPDYLGLSIFTLLCCCLPLGIAALIYSVKTQKCNKYGDSFQAQRNSQMAKKMNMWALGIGLCFLLIYIPLKIYLLLQSRGHSYP